MQIRIATTSFILCLAACFVASPSWGVVERLRTRIEIAADGSYVEHQQMTVRLDDRSQLDLWRSHAIALDEHRQLADSEAWRLDAQGRKKKLSRSERDEAEYAGHGVTFSSQHFLIFEPDLLEVGGRLIFDIRLAVDPYFPAGLLNLQPQGEAVEMLDIEIRSAAGPIRHRLAAAQDGEAVSAVRDRISADGTTLFITGSLPERIDPPIHAAHETRLLRFAWGKEQGWPDIARWYAEIEGTVDHGGDAFEGLAAEVVAAGDSPLERLEAAVAVARRKIRYVAVEVGIGGYRPSPASETAKRGWGDCKDKSLLLIELLRRAGLAAHPALIRLDPERRIDLELPTPYDFNHLIVAVESSGLALAAGAPISDGLLFVDPTQTTGGASYLHRGVQDQHALVVTGGPESGRLVRLPSLPESEMVELDAEIHVEAQKIAIDLHMRYLGETASYLSRSLDTTNPTDLEGAIRRMLLEFFPGAGIHDLVWDGRRDGLPAFEVRAKLDLASPDLAALRLPAPDLFPSLADLDGLEGHTAALSPAANRYRSRLHLPPGTCPPRLRNERVENDAGIFQYLVEMKDDAVEVSYEAILNRAWHLAEEMPELRELAVAEHRATRRRLRFRCGS